MRLIISLESFLLFVVFFILRLRLHQSLLTILCFNLPRMRKQEGIIIHDDDHVDCMNAHFDSLFVRCLLFCATMVVLKGHYCPLTCPEQAHITVFVETTWHLGTKHHFQTSLSRVLLWLHLCLNVFAQKVICPALSTKKSSQRMPLCLWIFPNAIFFYWMTKSL